MDGHLITRARGNAVVYLAPKDEGARKRGRPRKYRKKVRLHDGENSGLSRKYGHSRAYRVMLLDTGHLGQTLHLSATGLGLEVFTSAALQDGDIEQFLGIDGIREIPVYGGAVGTA